MALPPLHQSEKLPGRNIASQWNAVSMDADPTPSAEVVRLRNEVKSLKDRISSLHKAAKDLDHQKTKAKKHITSLESENEKLKAIREEFFTTRDKLHRLDTTKQQLERGLQCPKPSAGVESTAMIITPAQIEQSNQKTHGFLKSFASGAKSKQSRRLDIEAKVKRRLDKVGALNHRVNELEMELNGKREGVGKLTQIMTENKAAVDDVIAGAQTEAKQFRVEIRKNDEARDECVARLTELKSIINAGEPKDPIINLDDRNEKRQAKRNEIARLVEALKSAAEDEIATLTDQLVGLGIKRESIGKGSFEEEEDESDFTRQELLDRLKKIRGELSEAKNRFETGTREIDDLKKSASDHEWRLGEISKVIQGLISKRVITKP